MAQNAALQYHSAEIDLRTGFRNLEKSDLCVIIEMEILLKSKFYFVPKISL